MGVKNTVKKIKQGLETEDDERCYFIQGGQGYSF